MAKLTEQHRDLTESTGEVPLPGDLLGIVSIYTTTAVTFDLITMIAGNWRDAYAGGSILWKRKLRYETRDLLIDEAVIEANAGESKNVWFRYYLAKNRTFWGLVLYTDRTTGKLKSKQIKLPGPVLAAGFPWIKFGSDIRIKPIFIFQLADLSLVVGTKSQKHSIRIPFSERIREIISYYDDGQWAAVITERGRLHRVKWDGEQDLLLEENGPSGGVFGFAYKSPFFLLLRRDRSIDVYNQDTGRRRLSSSGRIPEIIQLDGFFPIFGLGFDGSVLELELEGGLTAQGLPRASGVSARRLLDTPQYDVGSCRSSGGVSRISGGVSGETLRGVRAGEGLRNIVVWTGEVGKQEGLYQLGDRTTVSHTANKQKIDRIEVATKNRTQFITVDYRRGLILLDF